jgi:hypothetical protein
VLARAGILVDDGIVEFFVARRGQLQEKQSLVVCRRVTLALLDESANECCAQAVFVYSSTQRIAVLIDTH